MSQTDRQADRQTDKQTDRQTGIQTVRRGRESEVRIYSENNSQSAIKNI